MNELCCGDCGKHIAWISKNAGPVGWIQCDECKESDELKEGEQ